MSTHGPGRTPPTPEIDTYEHLLNLAAATLSQAHALGFDWAEFVVVAVATSAADLGGSDTALSRRPGSWEAGLVRQLADAHVMPPLIGGLQQ